MYTKILVRLDGSQSAEGVLPYAVTERVVPNAGDPVLVIRAQT